MEEHVPPPSSRAAGASLRLHPPYLALAVVLAVAAYLRLWYVRQPFVDAFSWRQASTAMIAENFFRTNPNILLPEVNWTGPGPNYQGREFQTVTYLASMLYRVLGQHDWIGRGVAVAFGIWGIVALFLLTRRIWGAERGVVVAATMAVLPGSVFVERSFLPDPAMVALATTSVWLFVAWLQTGKRTTLLLGGVVGAWAFATKIPGLIVGLPMAYAALSILTLRGVLRRPTLVALGSYSAMVLLPVVLWYLWARHVALTYPPYHFAGEGNWIWNQGLRTWLEAHYFLPKLGQQFGTWIWTPSFGVLVAAGFVLGIVRPPAAPSSELARGTPRGAPYLFHWWLVAGAIYYAIGARELVDNPWNFHIINPAAAALGGLALFTVGSWVARMSARLSPRRSSLPMWATVSVLLALATWSSRQRALRMYTSYAKQGHALGLALQRVSRPGDLVLTMASALGDPTPIYYSRRRGWIFPPARDGVSWSRLPDDDAESIALLDELRDKGARWMGITRDQVRALVQHPRLAEHIRASSSEPIEEERFVIYRFTTPEVPR